MSKIVKKYKELLKCALLFLIGGALYYCIEILWRGHSHWTMAVVGGICFVVIGGLNNYIPWEMPMWEQGLVGALFVTGIAALEKMNIKITPTIEMMIEAAVKEMDIQNEKINAELKKD